MRNYIPLLLLSLFLTFGCAPDPLKQSFDQANLMFQQNRVSEAHQIYKDLCNASPNNTAYCNAYHATKMQIELQDLQQLRDKHSSLKKVNTLISRPNLMDLLSQYTQMKNNGASSNEFIQFGNILSDEQRSTESAITSAMANAEKALKDQNYAKMTSTLDSVHYLAPSVIDAKKAELNHKALNALYPEIKMDIKNEDWKSAHQKLTIANAISKTYKDISDLMVLAQKNDNPNYFFTLADHAKKKRDLDKVIYYYEKAATYPEATQKANELILTTKKQFIEFYFLLGVEAAENTLLKKAYDLFQKAFAQYKELPLEAKSAFQLPNADLQKYYQRLSDTAAEKSKTQNFGITLYYLNFIKSLHPDYPQIDARIVSAEKAIINRSLKSFAVMPFKSPAHASTVGPMLASNVLLAVHDTLKNDVKIIERESIDILLKEQELSMASNINGDQLKQFNIKSANFLLLGDVVDYGVESTEQKTSKSVRAQTGTQQKQNPDHIAWKQQSEALVKQNLTPPPAPPQYLEEPVLENIKYGVTFHKKVAHLSLSYRLVDTAQAKIIDTGIFDAKEEITDESREGVDIGDFRIEMKLPNLPSDIEMTRMVQNNIIVKLTDKIKGYFENPEIKYIEKAKQFENVGNLNQAIEMTANAIVLMNHKKKDTGDLNDTVLNYLKIIEKVK